MSKTRIELSDNFLSAVTKLSEGNPGALTALMEMARLSPIVDPDSSLGNFSPLISVDSLNIYGTDIYVLWNDICDRDGVKALAVLRSTQLGLFSREILKDAAGRQDRTGKSMVPVEELYQKVKEFLPNFHKEAKAGFEDSLNP
jgi:hypothetical protein